MIGRCRQSPCRRAFTLVEILVVVVILGIAGAIVVPHLLTAGQLGVQAAARSVIADILYAQNEAVAHQKIRAVIFSPDSESYQLTDEQGTPIEAAWRMGGGDRGYAIDFTRDKRFEGVKIVSADFSGQPKLEFDELGTPSSGGSIVLQYNEQQYRVNVAAFTGRVP
ncbi:MAG: GspH/FimT family pseudopilin, partial [Phycisphaeraceae bacterium]